MKGKFSLLIVLLAASILVAGCTQQPETKTAVTPAATPHQGTGGVGGAGGAGGTGHGQHGQGMGEYGTGNVSVSAIQSQISQYPAEQLTKEEKNGILYMREEEKLARDVYRTLYQKWGLQIFSNIARSEQTHMDAVKLLIDKYGLEDPAAGKGVGEFTNATLQKLYNRLVELGSKSEVDALKVGAMIEEIDILDLQKHIAETNKQDIKLVYENLMKGSRNHLRAFVSMLEKYGVTYTPQYLSEEEYNQIIQSSMERGPAQS